MERVLLDRRLHLVYEPEAAALSFVSNSQNPVALKEGSTLINVDCGGGSVDITSHKVSQKVIVVCSICKYLSIHELVLSACVFPIQVVIWSSAYVTCRAEQSDLHDGSKNPCHYTVCACHTCQQMEFKLGMQVLASGAK